MSALEVVMMKRIGELKAENEALKAEVGELCEAIKLASEVGIKMADEVTRLKAENERLTHLANQSEFYRSQLQKDTCRLENIQMQDAFKHYEAENARLKAEVERLRKAGDAMVQLLCHMDVVMDMDSDHPEVEAWNAAKEGRPNE